MFSVQTRTPTSLNCHTRSIISRSLNHPKILHQTSTQPIGNITLLGLPNHVIEETDLGNEHCYYVI
jgi:hypothetical protein